MSVLIETTLGELTVDLYAEDAPRASENFLKLCKIKYYNGVLIHNVQKDLLVQAGDPTGTGAGGDSVFRLADGARREELRFFGDEIKPYLKHEAYGTLSMANFGRNRNCSQFLITTRERCPSLDGAHTVFGRVTEGFDVLGKINGVMVDEGGRPLQNIRILHTFVLDDPFPDTAAVLALVPPASPRRLLGGADRLEYGEDPKKGQTDEAERRDAEDRSKQYVLEMAQDLPFAEIKPAENVLFVCKLNPVTDEAGLELIFSRFGPVHSVQIIRDHDTGNSLCYGFVEFKEVDDAERAYAKMDNALVDMKRIHVDFSQSVAKSGSIGNYRIKNGKWVAMGSARGRAGPGGDLAWTKSFGQKQADKRYGLVGLDRRDLDRDVEIPEELREQMAKHEKAEKERRHHRHKHHHRRHSSSSSRSRSPTPERRRKHHSHHHRH